MFLSDHDPFYNPGNDSQRWDAAIVKVIGHTHAVSAVACQNVFCEKGLSCNLMLTLKGISPSDTETTQSNNESEKCSCFKWSKLIYSA